MDLRGWWGDGDCDVNLDDGAVTWGQSRTRVDLIRRTGSTIQSSLNFSYQPKVLFDFWAFRFWFGSTNSLAFR